MIVVKIDKELTGIPHLKDELKNSTAENNKESNEDKKEKFNFNSFLKNDFVGLENLPKIDY